MDFYSSNELTQSLSLSTNDHQICFTNKKRPKSKHSAVSIHPLNKVPDSLESKEDEQNKSKICQEVEEKMNSASLNKITVVKLSRKDLSKSSHNRSNEDLTINDNTKSNDQSLTNTEKSNNVRRRNSSLSAVTVTKIKQMAEDTKVVVDYKKRDAVLNSNAKKSSTTRVTRISKKKRSTIQPHHSNN